jgi:hypothetical protein
MSDEQKGWAKLQNQMVLANALILAVKPENKLRQSVWHLVVHPKFEQGIIGMILLNTMVLCMEISNASDGYKAALWYLNTIFVFVFLAEAIVKLIAFGPTYYFKVTTN